MENESENLIDNRYIILNKIGNGGSAKVFIVEEKSTGHIYAAKVLKDYDDERKKRSIEKMFNNEITILIHLKNKIDNLYITNIINNGSGEIKRLNRPTSTNKYLILEYAEKGCLFDYIYYPETFLKERYGKLIFQKILKGIQVCHQSMIFHRDIKLENILLDNNYNPKICDFGLAKINQKKAIEPYGTQSYAAPEVLSNRLYDCSKIDIFSLGVTLFYLINRKPPFKKKAVSNDELDSLIKSKSFDSYWNKLKENGIGIELSEQFKKLYISMVLFESQNRPNIEDILNSEWLKEIRDLNNEQINELENEVKKEFDKREIIIKEKKKKNILAEGISSLLNESDTRGGTEEIKTYFDYNLKPKFIEDENLIKNYNFIKIKGNLNPSNFMNLLANKINKLFEDKCLIEESKYMLKFNVIFEDENEEEDDDNENEENEEKEEKEEKEENNEDGKDKEDENIINRECIIQVKLFENNNKEYLLRFAKKCGELEDYYKNVDKINDLVKNFLS